jgi:hypothetical protein
MNLLLKRLKKQYEVDEISLNLCMEKTRQNVLNGPIKRGARSAAKNHYLWGQVDGCNTGVICH